MSNTKSIEDMIESDALKLYPVVMERDFNPLASEMSFDINEEKRKAYTAGRLKGIEDAWISVEDRLPDEGGRYWCYVEEVNDLGISHFQWNCCYHDDSKTWTDNFVNMHVTHWQPLPTPPTKDK